MLLHRPITVPAELPAIGSAFETSIFDMKVTITKHALAASRSPQYNQFEMAKDVAAFANAVGGTLLIGAAEDGTTGVLKGYRPLGNTTAHEIITAFNDAVTGRCSPRPLIDPQQIPVAGGQVVAINVTAFPGQPLGVRIDGDRADGFGGHAFVFPLRVGRNTIFITPEQLPMLMLPEVRYTAIRLAQIPSGVDGALVTNDRSAILFSKIEVDSLGATVTFTLKVSGLEINLPIDGLGKVWEDRRLARWTIEVRGNLHRADHPDGRVSYQYAP